MFSKIEHPFMCLFAVSLKRRSIYLIIWSKNDKVPVKVFLIETFLFTKPSLFELSLVFFTVVQPLKLLFKIYEICYKCYLVLLIRVDTHEIHNLGARNIELKLERSFNISSNPHYNKINHSSRKFNKIPPAKHA